MSAYTFGIFTHLLVVMVAFGASTLIHAHLLRLPSICAENAGTL